MAKQKWICEKCGSSYDDENRAKSCERGHSDLIKESIKIDQIFPTNVDRIPTRMLFHLTHEDYRDGCRVDINSTFCYVLDPLYN